MANVIPCKKLLVDCWPLKLNHVPSEQYSCIKQDSFFDYLWALSTCWVLCELVQDHLVLRNIRDHLCGSATAEKTQSFTPMRNGCLASIETVR